MYDPDIGHPSSPQAPEPEQDVALVVDQDMVDWPPELIVLGVALMLRVGRAGGGVGPGGGGGGGLVLTLTVVCAVVEPEELVAVRVYVVVEVG